MLIICDGQKRNWQTHQYVQKVIGENRILTGILYITQAIGDRSGKSLFTKNISITPRGITILLVKTL